MNPLADAILELLREHPLIQTVRVVVLRAIESWLLESQDTD